MDAAKYLESCDERASTAFAIGSDDDLGGGPLRSEAEVEALIDQVLGVTVARVGCGRAELRIEFGAQIDKLSVEERDALTAGVGLGVADEVRSTKGDVQTEARGSGFAVRLEVPQQERPRMAAHLLDVARVSYSVAQALLGQDPEVEPMAPKGKRRKGAAS